MLELLRTYYGISGQESPSIRGIPSYVANNKYYLLLRISEHDHFMMEQAVIAYYLKEQEHPHIAYPIQNIDGQFMTTVDDQRYTVFELRHLQKQPQVGEGTALAQFHQQTKRYPYEPYSISSYGKWKQLWTDKLTVYEQNLQAALKEERDEQNLIWLDLFPYVIGMTENAIQYVGEMNHDRSFHDSDRPAITFERYDHQLQKPCFFSYELHYDHPMRDVAELIRYNLLQEGDETTKILQFLHDYERVQPISLFSWKMIYSRLLYPAHFFDAIDQYRNKSETVTKDAVMQLCDKQHIYEARITTLFNQIKRNDQTIRIPMVQWM